MKKIILSSFLLLLCGAAFSQYSLYKSIDGVQIYTKWGHENWLKKKSDKVLLIKVVNKNAVAVDFDLGIEFFSGMVMVEESKPAHYCLSANKTILPRWHGIVFKPIIADVSAIESFELTEMEIVKSAEPACKR